MHKNPRDILQTYWGFSKFKASQEQIITAILEKKDVLALLPTGGGKSLCFQIPALATEGICIVVSPLIALIKNQVDTLKNKGIKALALTGSISQHDVIDLMDNCLYGNYKFLYLSPERLQQELIRERIQQMSVNLIAIDEAHCISQWGNDFRPAYLDCAVLRELAPKVPIIALTATATTVVANDIVKNLQLKNPLIEKTSFSRDNITFSVQWDEDKPHQLQQILSKTHQSAIVYVRTRMLSKNLATMLTQHKISSTFYHGGLSKKEKDHRLELWLQNKTQVMVATNAFGLGIDKSDVSVVIHYQIPDSMENYFQEAGRAGRDGAAAKAILLTNKADEIQVKMQFLSGLPDVAFLKLLYNKLNNYFQISFGELRNETYLLNFNAFCDAYKLNPFLTYNALRILDQHSVLALSESFSKKTSIRFIATKNQIFDYLETFQNSAHILQTILRTYGGIFEHDTKINTWSLAKKANVSEVQITTTLKQLEKDRIINYLSQHNDMEIVFLVPREDDRTVHIFAKKVEALIEQKTKQIDAMLAYVKNNTKCRSQQLLSYFGEKRDPCGQCDVCVSAIPINHMVIELAKEALLKELQKQPQTSRALIKLVLYKEEVILIALQSLLENELITLNTTNQYKIS